jgi:hypothetical protein
MHPSIRPKATQLTGHKRQTMVSRFAHIHDRPPFTEIFCKDLDLEGVEFSALPSGLHLVPQDVVCVFSIYWHIQLASNMLSRYFTKDDRHGVCIFRRRETTEENHRGFRLSSLGILLANSTRPRPWRHVPALKALIETIYAGVGNRGEPTEKDWDLAGAFFEERKTRVDIRVGDWNGWSHELDGVSIYSDICIVHT